MVVFFSAREHGVEEANNATYQWNCPKEQSQEVPSGWGPFKLTERDNKSDASRDDDNES